MKRVSIIIEDYLYAFYTKVGENAGGLPPEQVMADALFRLAGELAGKAVQQRSGEKPHH